MFPPIVSSVSKIIKKAPIDKTLCETYLLVHDDKGIVAKCINKCGWQLFMGYWPTLEDVTKAHDKHMTN